MWHEVILHCNCLGFSHLTSKTRFRLGRAKSALHSSTLALPSTTRSTLNNALYPQQAALSSMLAMGSPLMALPGNLPSTLLSRGSLLYLAMGSLNTPDGCAAQSLYAGHGLTQHPRRLCPEALTRLSPIRSPQHALRPVCLSAGRVLERVPRDKRPPGLVESDRSSEGDTPVESERSSERETPVDGQARASMNLPSTGERDGQRARDGELGDQNNVGKEKATRERRQNSDRINKTKDMAGENEWL